MRQGFALCIKYLRKYKKILTHSPLHGEEYIHLAFFDGSVFTLKLINLQLEQEEVYLIRTLDNNSFSEGS